MAKKKQPKDLPFEEIIRQFVRFAVKLEKEGGAVGFQIQFKPSQPEQQLSGKTGDAK